MHLVGLLQGFVSGLYFLVTRYRSALQAILKSSYLVYEIFRGAPRARQRASLSISPDQVFSFCIYIHAAINAAMKQPHSHSYAAFQPQGLRAFYRRSLPIFADLSHLLNFALSLYIRIFSLHISLLRSEDTPRYK